MSLEWQTSHILSTPPGGRREAAAPAANRAEPAVPAANRTEPAAHVAERGAAANIPAVPARREGEPVKPEPIRAANLTPADAKLQNTAEPQRIAAAAVVEPANAVKASLSRSPIPASAVEAELGGTPRPESSRRIQVASLSTDGLLGAPNRVTNEKARNNLPLVKGTGLEGDQPKVIKAAFTPAPRADAAPASDLRTAAVTAANLQRPVALTERDPTVKSVKAVVNKDKDKDKDKKGGVDSRTVQVASAPPKVEEQAPAVLAAARQAAPKLLRGANEGEAQVAAPAPLARQTKLEGEPLRSNPNLVSVAFRPEGEQGRGPTPATKPLKANVSGEPLHPNLASPVKLTRGATPIENLAS